MKVVLGIGGSEDSLEALRRTVDRALEAGDDLTVAILDNPESERSFEEIEETTRQTLDEAGCSADIRHIEGDPGSELVQLAEREEYDQIVIGGGQQSPMGKIRLGPIAEFVLLNSTVTVTLVR
ncbi:MAG: universal stress protein [Halanaeroarchaeum sp.]